MAQPVAGGSAASHASALAAMARDESTTPLGRPVVPEVRTTTAGASGSRSGGGNGSSVAVTPARRRTSDGSSTPSATATSRDVSPRRDRCRHGARAQDADEGRDAVRVGSAGRSDQGHAISRRDAGPGEGRRDGGCPGIELRPRQGTAASDQRDLATGVARVPRQEHVREPGHAFGDLVPVDDGLVDRDPERPAPWAARSAHPPGLHEESGDEQVIAQQVRRCEPVVPVDGRPTGHVRQRRGTRETQRQPHARLEQRADHHRHAPLRGERRDLGDCHRATDARRLHDQDIGRPGVEHRAGRGHGRDRLVGRDRDADPFPERRPLGQRPRVQRLLHVLQREPGQRPQAPGRRLQAPRAVGVQPQRDVVANRGTHGSHALHQRRGRVRLAGLELQRPEPGRNGQLGGLDRRSGRPCRDRGVDPDGRQARGPLSPPGPRHVEARAVQRGSECSPGGPGPVHECG